MKLRCMLVLWVSGCCCRDVWCTVAIGKTRERSFCSDTDGRSYVRPLFSGLSLEQFCSSGRAQGVFRESKGIKVPGV